MIDSPIRTEEELARLGTDIQRRIGVKTSRNDPLARFTTMRVGGPADLFAEIHNLFELRAIVRFARSRELPYFILGRGSDLVISDKGIRGLVIHNRAQQLKFEGHPFHRRLGPAHGQGGHGRAAPRACRVWSSGWPSRAPSGVPFGPTPARMNRRSGP